MGIDNDIESYSTEYKENHKIINKITNKSTANLLKVKLRQFNANDVLYWNSFGISLQTLKLFNVKSISHVFINDNIFLAERLAYVYTERIKDSKYIKIYQPYGKVKWLTNMPKKVLFAYTKIPKRGKLLIITKALKEIMSLYETAKIPSIGVQSEHVMINSEVLKDLQNRFDNILTMFDNDKQGVKLKKRYEEIGVKGFTFEEAKNYSDLIEDKGVKYSLIKLKEKTNATY
jgi:hypothetical protein